MEELFEFSTLQGTLAHSPVVAVELPAWLSATALPILLVVANVLGVGMIVPQVARLHRHRCADGVSGSWIGVGITLNLWWLAYGIHEGLWGLLPVSSGAFLLYSIIAAQLIAIGGWPARQQLLFGSLVLGAGPLPFLLLDGWSAAGAAIGLSYGVQFVPAAASAMRASTVAGVSASTWTMAWIEAAIWLLYGVEVNDRALLFGGGGGLAVASLILVLLALKPRDLPVAPADAADIETDPDVNVLATS
jgi:uncharacterized protein with PQ loop repeat